MTLAILLTMTGNATLDGVVLALIVIALMLGIVFLAKRL